MRKTGGSFLETKYIRPPPRARPFSLTIRVFLVKDPTVNFTATKSSLSLVFTISFHALQWIAVPVP